MSPHTLQFNGDCRFSRLACAGATACGLQVGQSDTILFQTPLIPKSSRTTVGPSPLLLALSLLALVCLSLPMFTFQFSLSPLIHLAPQTKTCAVSSHGKLNPILRAEITGCVPLIVSKEHSAIISKREKSLYA